MKEHRVDRTKIYAIGIECFGKTDTDKIRQKGYSAISDLKDNGTAVGVETIYGDSAEIPKHEIMAERCLSCKSKKVVVCDEMIGENGEVVTDCTRFDEVEKLEKMTPEERFEFWQNELSRCIRCNACRNVCPACTCENCVEENMFHIIRAFHVAGRCTDCGQCSRVCPQHIPLHLLNRKFIKDADELYGEYRAGEDMDSKPTLLSFDTDDCEPSIVYERGGND